MTVEIHSIYYTVHERIRLEVRGLVFATVMVRLHSQGFMDAVRTVAVRESEGSGPQIYAFLSEIGCSTKS